MSHDESAVGPDDDDLVAETASLLETFGLTSYEAKCFVALTRIGHGTAREIAEVADVPRPRVYDSVESLADRGLADVQDAQPRRFRAPEPRDAVETVRREYGERLDRLEGLLPRLQSPEPREERAGVWVVEGDDAVSDRLAALADDAGDELLVVLAVESLLTDEVRDALAAADERGVEITVASPSPAIREAVAETVPAASVVETWTWWESHPIRAGEISAILMADGRELIVSSDLETDLPGIDRHSAVWTDDERAPLVGLMRPLLAEAIRSGSPAHGPA
ncbi:TrmB family transcriptional regulator [Halosimplex rubrum]|uniref:TrmB family transcriptional regulator n=1 Tax=Halosimplex rubrum TaxID=869889 RepID=A0A7D5P300_9EURY|nr:helix-turn-helix domain-containing protein [Halosimplex rubrum]QLH77801.1 TrmB family transcriptional regulator [Halosimplex rubrum]